LDNDAVALLKVDRVVDDGFGVFADSWVHTARSDPIRKIRAVWWYAANSMSAERIESSVRSTFGRII
jgi:hypothetical protein